MLDVRLADLHWTVSLQKLRNIGETRPHFGGQGSDFFVHFIVERLNSPSQFLLLSLVYQKKHSISNLRYGQPLLCLAQKRAKSEQMSRELFTLR